jgi:para-nitrobenzyl esterase
MMAARWLGLASGLLMAATLPVGGASAANDAGVIRTTDGPITVNAPDEAGIAAYKGIPFGAPPVGANRWREPQPVAHWDEARQFTEFGDVCIQPKGHGRLNVSVDLPTSPKASEDCLYLNVWTGAKAGDKQPVMVWIFGGAYSEGAGSSPHNWGHKLAQKGVVVVTFNYRLGPFGFFAHPALAAASGHDASGNYALMDAISTLEWVKANIAAFGGDPDNVTIFGESAGAAMVAGLTGSPLAQGLYERAISESGAWMGLSMAPMRGQAETEAAGKAMADKIGAATAQDLRALSAENVTAGLRGFGMMVDGWVVPQDLSITFAEGRQNKVDVLTGTNRDEGSFLPGAPPPEAWRAQMSKRWGDLAERFLALYPSATPEETLNSARRVFSDEMEWHNRLFAQRQAAIGQNAYLYYFRHEPHADPDKRDLGATHTAEIPYVFNNLLPPRVYPDSSSPELNAKDPVEIKLADEISDYWVNFAATGDPNGDGLPLWPQVDEMKPGEAMVLDVKKGVKEVIAPEKLALFDALYKRQMGGE